MPNIVANYNFKQTYDSSFFTYRIFLVLEEASQRFHEKSSQQMVVR